MTNRYMVIVNPVSGRGFGGKSIPKLKQLFTQAERSYTLLTTEYPGHATTLTQQAISSGYDIVVAVGGDGTANEVLNGLMSVDQNKRKTITMGVIAIGRGNDFAYGMGIPSGLEAGSEILFRGNRRSIDVGFVRGGDFPDGRYFGNGLGIGFDAVVGFEALKITWLSGFPSYIVAVLKTIFLYFQAPLTKIVTEDQSIQLSSLMISVMNGRRLGGGFLMAPDASNFDGLFDICIAEEVSRLRVFGLVPHFLKGSQSSQREIHTLRSTHLEVTAINGTLPVHADGETICVAGDRLEIALLPNQLEVICSPELSN